jgi:hypothetical protein
MYTAAIVLHSVLRWVVILLGVLAVARAFSGRSSGRSWTAADATPGRLYTMALDVQMVIGLLLYFVFSHILSIAGADWGEAMGNTAIRYWVVEHLAAMVVAIALAHVGPCVCGRPPPTGAEAGGTLLRPVAVPRGPRVAVAGLFPTAAHCCDFW